MIDLLHTIDCPIPGFQALQITVNLGYTDQQIIEGWQAGENRAIACFPNWTDAAMRLCLDAGEPPVPLTMQRSAAIFPIILSAYLTGYDVINDALRDYMATSRPFLRTR